MHVLWRSVYIVFKSGSSGFQTKYILLTRVHVFVPLLVTSLHLVTPTWFFVGNNYHSRWCIWNWFLQSPCSFHTKTGLLHSLAEALKGKPLTLIWNLEMKQSIAAAKYVLANVPALVLHPHPSARIPLSVDAFSSYFGTVSHQELAGSWAPLAIYSKKLSAPKTKYLFAAYSSLRHFR